MSRDEWRLGTDGAFEHPDADPDCDRCKGHGLLDEGDFACILVECPCVAGTEDVSP